MRIFTSSFIFLAAISLSAAEPEPAGVRFFETKIHPVLKEKCYECHAADAEEIKGGLLLDTPEGLQKGGDNGPVLVPGKPFESLIFIGLTHEDPDFDMPPKEKLPMEVILDFGRWIIMGAPDPRPESKKAKKAPAKKGKHGSDIE